MALCTSAALTPLVGWAIDTRGVRPVALLAVALAGGALLGLARVTGQLELGLWFALLRFAGPESMVGCVLLPPPTHTSPRRPNPRLFLA